MSRAPTEEDQSGSGTAYLAEYRALNTLLRLGKSFSGNERNNCFLNTGRGTFCNISACSGLDFPDDGRAVATVDWDHDGDSDLWLTNRAGPGVRFLRNDAGSGNNFISFYLQGNGDSTNRDAVGARVELHIEGDERKWIATVRAGDGYLSQATRWVTFGMADIRSVKRISVHWPGGDIETFNGVATNAWYELVQGSGKAQPWLPPDREIKLKPSSPSTNTRTEVPRTFLAVPFPIPDLENVARHDGKSPTLLMLWATWCLPCISELKELANHSDAVREKGLRVIAVNVDAATADDADSSVDPQAILKRMDFKFESATASPELLDKLTFVSDTVFQLRIPLSVPLSFLLDQNGDLAAVYRGAFKIDRVLADLEHLHAEPPERRILASPLGGRWFGGLPTQDLLEAAANYFEAGYTDDAEGLLERIKGLMKDEPGLYTLLGRIAQQSGRTSDAIQYFEQSLALQPDIQVYRSLAVAHASSGDIKPAATAFEKALQLTPENGNLHFQFAMFLSEVGQRDRAIDHADRATRHNVELTEAFILLGRLLSDVGKFDEARAAYGRGLTAHPNNARLVNGLGVVYFRGNQISEAIRRFEQALEIDPSYQAARNNLNQARQRASRRNVQ